MKHWSEVYPHSLFASVLLLDNKIEMWKVSDTAKKNPFEFSGFWKRDRINDYTSEYIEFVVNDDDEHNKVFSELAPKWFMQWEHADDYRGFKAHSKEEEEVGIQNPVIKKTHVLKTVQPFFDEVVKGNKTFEVRKNDRDFRVGDFLELREYKPPTNSYGRIVNKKISYILSHDEFEGVSEGYVVLGLHDVNGW